MSTLPTIPTTQPEERTMPIYHADCPLCRMRQTTAPEFITARPSVSLVKAYVR